MGPEYFWSHMLKQHAEIISISLCSTYPYHILHSELFNFTPKIMSAFYFCLKVNQIVLKSQAQARWLLIPSESPLLIQILFPSLQIFSYRQK